MYQQKYYPINDSDIHTLKKNGCHAEDWSQVMGAEGFNPERIHDVFLAGEVKIGSLTGETDMLDGITKKSGISRAYLNNVSIGDNCYIKNVHIGLFNVNIESNVWIENVGRIVCVGETSFGNGHEISVLNEAGGRELKITKETSAQIAYLTVFYRHNKVLINRLNKLYDEFSYKNKSNKIFIGRNVKIFNCNEIINVYIAECAIINGALSLKQGTIDSSKEAPTFIGNGVIAEHFIFQKGSSIKDGAMIVSSLVGEGTQVGKQFSSENSLFFANSECFHSEVCSVYAGPYTVTHHRSTLLIAGFFSFYNAGSGTNQSNHMYKLGPIHQGILERGCKTGSFSYLLWPARVGAFTAVLGKHYADFDTSDLPFSYIDESDGKSTIVPGMNFFTAGTIRDGLKWPARDRRKSSKKLDLIIFDVLSPYTVQKIIRGQRILADLYENTEKKQEYVAYKGISIKRLLLKTCKRYYQLAIEKYFGDVLINRIQEDAPHRMRDILKYNENAASGIQEWIDVCGLVCPKSRIENLIAEIVSGKIADLAQLYEAFEKIYHAYKIDEWNWFLANYRILYGHELAEQSNERIKQFMNSWKESSKKFYNMVLQDTQKEFEGNVRIGYGIDGNVDADFENIRGTFDENNFVKKIRNEIEETHLKYESIQKLIK